MHELTPSERRAYYQDAIEVRKRREASPGSYDDGNTEARPQVNRDQLRELVREPHTWSFDLGDYPTNQADLVGTFADAVRFMLNLEFSRGGWPARLMCVDESEMPNIWRDNRRNRRLWLGMPAGGDCWWSESHIRDVWDS